MSLAAGLHLLGHCIRMSLVQLISPKVRATHGVDQKSCKEQHNVQVSALCSAFQSKSKTGLSQ